MITNFFCLVTSLKYPHATLCPGYFPCCNNNRKSDAESWRWMVFPELERPRNDPRGTGASFYSRLFLTISQICDCTFVGTFNTQSQNNNYTAFSWIVTWRWLPTCVGSVNARETYYRSDMWLANNLVFGGYSYVYTQVRLHLIVCLRTGKNKERWERGCGFLSFGLWK